MLFSTTFKAILVAKLVIAGILLLASFILELRVLLITELVNILQYH